MFSQLTEVHQYVDILLSILLGDDAKRGGEKIYAYKCKSNQIMRHDDDDEAGDKE